MDLGSLITQTNHKVFKHADKSSLKSLETAKGVFIFNENLFGNYDYTYYGLLIDLFDRAMLTDNLYCLSTEQQVLLEKYFDEADKLSDEYSLSKQIKQLDEFLGSYVGEDNGQYTKYGKKQFHCKRQPFS